MDLTPEGEERPCQVLASTKPSSSSARNVLHVWKGLPAEEAAALGARGLRACHTVKGWPRKGFTSQTEAVFPLPATGRARRACFSVKRRAVR